MLHAMFEYSAAKCQFGILMQHVNFESLMQHAVFDYLTSHIIPQASFVTGFALQLALHCNLFLPEWSSPGCPRSPQQWLSISPHLASFPSLSEFCVLQSLQLTISTVSCHNWLLSIMCFVSSLMLWCSGEAAVVAQSLALLATDSVSFLVALSASQLHSSPTMFNPPSTPEPTSHPLLRNPADMDIVTLPNKILGKQHQCTQYLGMLHATIRGMMMCLLLHASSVRSASLIHNKGPQFAAICNVMLCCTELGIAFTKGINGIVQMLAHQRYSTYGAQRSL